MRLVAQRREGVGGGGQEQEGADEVWPHEEEDRHMEEDARGEEELAHARGGGAARDEEDEERQQQLHRQVAERGEGEARLAAARLAGGEAQAMAQARRCVALVSEAGGEVTMRWPAGQDVARQAGGERRGSMRGEACARGEATRR